MNQLTNIYKILSDETRLRILVLLYNEDLCVCQLCGILNTSQPKISKNLSKLRDMQLVLDSRKEKFVYYRLERENPLLMTTLKQIVDQVNQYPQLMEDLDRLKDKDVFLKQCFTTIE